MITIEYKKFPQASLKTVPLNYTQFPDGTTQVWKLSEMPTGEIKVIWKYEKEDELIKIIQLSHLLTYETNRHHIWSFPIYHMLDKIRM